MANSFEDLEVWKRSCRLSVRLYKTLKGCRDYSLKDQMLRSAVSVPSNIAEGSERGTVRDFQRFLDIAKGSAAELRTQVYIASEVNLIEESERKTLISELKEISKMLQGLHKSLKGNKK